MNIAFLTLSALAVALIVIVVRLRLKITRLEAALSDSQSIIDSQSRWFRAACVNSKYSFAIKELYGEFIVCKVCIGYPDNLVFVKSFKDEDKEYAKLCAEELCEKLNENL